MICHCKLEIYGFRLLCLLTFSANRFYRRIIEHDENLGISKKSCDLADEVQRSNKARANMMGYDKYDMFIINPMFGTGLHYSNCNEVSLDREFI